MRPLGALLPFDEARRRILDAFPPTTATEEVALLGAAGRVLASDIVAPIDVPSFDRSAMDGYAVRAAETRDASEPQPARFRRVGVIHAGAPIRKRVQPGTCSQIATGAPLPPGADAVVKVERTRQDGAWIEIQRPVKAGENVTHRGADIRRGKRVLAKGTLLTPPRMAALAAIGQTRARVYGRARVALLATGSELREPGARLGPGQIYNSNTPALRSLLETHGAHVEPFRSLPDALPPLRAALRRRSKIDLFLVTGGSSAGERDLLIDAIHADGTMVLHGVNVRPGKPLILARVGGTPVIGLPGNPASCLLMTYALVVPALRRLQRLPPQWERRIPARLASAVASPPGVRHFLPVRIEADRAIPTYKESDATTSLAPADGYIEIPDAVERLGAGTPVDVVLF